ncbi:glycoside hydrolase family 28 protein [Opitutus sp. ER46]|uniref:glycoside hydrolase family 28 protein n=1 Tax=Opitutus sp. ER46 TaxID=2161864 RepID=UPI001304E79B|nr:glycoside hydrolase family 28 protein [Opitutus sp. ER46]
MRAFLGLVFTVLLALPGLAASSSTLAPLRAFVAPQTLRSDEVTLIWEKALPGTAVTYQITRDSVTVGRTTATHFTAKGLTPATDVALVVAALDASGREVARSARLVLKTPAKETVLNVESFGAKGDGQTSNTKAIQAAIDACPVGGVVLIPRGVFVSGALFLKSDMTLEVAAGATLQGSAVLADYEPFIRNRFEGWELDTYASLLNAGRLDHQGPANVRNLSIRGAGRIAGGGWPLGKAMIAARGIRSRARLILLMNCENVEIQGVTLEEPPAWTLHYLYCENVTCHDLTITTAVRNGDGIDPDSSRHSYIFNCTFDTGDDCIAIKSGKNPEGNRINRPTERVWVFNCVFKRGHGISIGSEMSGGVRDVLVQDCVAGNLMHGLQIKATPERGNVVEGVVVRDCDLQKISILTALPYNNDGEAAPEAPYFRNFRFENLDLTKAPANTAVVLVNGFAQPGHRTKGVTFDRVRLPAGAVVQVKLAEDVRFTGVTTADGKPPTYQVTESERVVY